MQERALSPRQEEALRGIVEDRTDREIAAAMGVHLGTAKQHVQALYRFLGVRNRKQAFQVAVRRGWATLGGKWRGTGA
jgi:DNA-binding CsgD family transcriptional regulator